MKKGMLAVFFFAVCGVVFGQEQTTVTGNQTITAEDQTTTAEDQTTTAGDQTTVTDGAKSKIELLLSSKTLESNFYRTTNTQSMREQEIVFGIFLTKENDTLLKGGISTEILENKTPLDFDIGARLFLTYRPEPDEDVMGLAPGIRAQYTLKFIKQFPIHLASSIYYAPKIITSGTDIDILDVEPIRAEFELTQNLKAVAGFRILKVGDTNLDNDYSLGVSYRF